MPTVITTIAEGRIIRVNRAFLELTGYLEEEVLSRTTTELNIWAQQTERDRIVKLLREHGAAKGEEVVMCRRSGEKRNCLFSAVVVHSDGEPCILSIVVDVTERFNAERALAESEERYRLLIENMFETMWVLDLNIMKFVYNTPSSVNLLGYTAEELSKLSMADIIAPESMEVIGKELVKELEIDGLPGVEPDRSRTLELKQIHKNGSFIWTEITTRFLRDDSGKPTRVLGISRNITERKIAEERQHAYQEQLQATLKALPDLLFEVDREGNIYDYNAQHNDELYIAPEKFLGRNVTDVLPAQAAAAAMNAIQEAAQKGRHLGADYYLDFPTGRRWYELSIASKGNHAAPDSRFIVLVREITEAMKNVNALARSEEKYRTIIDTMQEGYFETDLSGHLTFVNKSLLEIGGYGEEDLIGRQFRKYADENMMKRIFETFARIYKTGQDEQALDLEIVRKDGGRRNIEMSISLKRDAAGNPAGFRGVVHDVTARMKAELELWKSQEAYREVVDKSPVGIFKTSPLGKLSFVNTAFAEIFGYESAEEVLAGASDVFASIYFDPGDSSRTIQLLKDHGEFIDEEFCCKKKNETPFWVTASCRSLLDESGTVVGVEGFVTDITKRKDVEEKLAWELKVNMALNGISERILSRSLSIEGLSDTVRAYAKALTRSPDAFVREFASEQIEKAAAAPDAGEFERIMAEWSGALLTGNGVMVREAMYTNDAAHHEFISRTADGAGVRRFLMAPAAMRGELLGIIALANSERKYSDSDLTAIQRLADLYAIAINRIRNEEKIELSLKEKELLLKEIHHRVKNNMQIISSLLGLQSSHVKDERDSALFEVSQSRVRSMALVHEKLYQSDSLSGLDFQDYITDLVKELSASHYLDDRITIDVNAKNVFVNIDDAIPCSLIVYELVSNALKHAFPGKRSGRITIDFSRKDGTFFLRVSDNGTGMPPGLDYRKTNSLGLQLVNALAQQLGGTVSLESGDGTSFTIAFRGQS